MMTRARKIVGLAMLSLGVILLVALRGDSGLGMSFASVFLEFDSILAPSKSC
jgi:hypothetical protein